MAKAILVTGGSTNNIASTTAYLHIGNAPNQRNTSTENLSQRTVRTSGVFSNLQINVISNAATASSTCRTRVNSGDGSMSIAISAAATGLFEDNSNTDSLSAGDEINLSIVVGSGGNLNISATSILFDASSDTVSYLIQGNTAAYATASTTTYNILVGGGTNHPTTEAEAQTRCGACTLKNLFTYVSVNARSTASTYRTRKAGANGNQSVSITASTTGFFEDNANTDSVTDGQLCDTSLVTGTGTGNLTLRTRSVEYVTTDSSGLLSGGNTNGLTQNQGVTAYWALSDGFSPNATESNRQLEINQAGTLSKLWIYIRANTVSATSTFRTRVNTANGSIAASITASTTGAFQDISNTDSVTATDLVNLQLVTGAGGTSLSWSSWSLLFTLPSAGGDQPLIKRIQTIPFLGGSLRTNNF